MAHPPPPLRRRTVIRSRRVGAASFPRSLA
jgi:hypothetical protein